MSRLFSRGAALALASALICAPSAPASDPHDNPPTSELQALRKEMAELRAAHERELQALETRVRALEGEMNSADASTAPSTPATPSTDDAALAAEIAKALAGPAPAAEKPGARGEVRFRLLDLSLGALFAAGGSSEPDAITQQLQGGAHDPQQRGVTLQNLELSFAGAVDPYLRGETHIVFQLDPEGESTFEVEEAFLTTQSLPHGLQIKGGQYFTEFGRQNPQHPHQWQFVDAPVASTRMFGGDGLRGPGARLSWLTPAPWYSEVIAGVQNARGETAYSFFGAKDDQVAFAGHPLVDDDVKSIGDLLYTARWLNSVSVSHSTTLNIGLSGAWGPNSTGHEGRTTVAGFDSYLKWTARSAEKGFPFVAWQTEAMKRHYIADAFIDTLGAMQPKEALDDWGAYTQVTWGFHRRCMLGFRGDWADGERGLVDDNSLDPTRDKRFRASLAFTWLPSEFSKLKFQINHDVSEFLDGGDSGTANSAWLQWEFNLGAHGAHQF